MSQIRVYRNGRPAWLELEPAYARRVGFGGVSLGHFSGTTLTLPKRKPKGTATPEERAAHRSKPRCGIPLPQLGEPCARTAGHREAHRSAYAVEADNARRRRIYDGFSA